MTNSELQIKAHAQAVVDCTTVDEHSDGMAMCHQIVAKMFIDSLTDNGLLKNQVLAKDLVKWARECALFATEELMSRSSRKIVRLAKGVLSAPALTPQRVQGIINDSVR